MGHILKFSSPRQHHSPSKLSAESQCQIQLYQFTEVGRPGQYVIVTQHTLVNSLVGMGHILKFTSTLVVIIISSALGRKKSSQ